MKLAYVEYNNGYATHYNITSTDVGLKVEYHSNFHRRTETKAFAATPDDNWPHALRILHEAGISLESITEVTFADVNPHVIYFRRAGSDKEQGLILDLAAYAAFLKELHEDSVTA